jgi:hypothetical protein
MTSDFGILPSNVGVQRPPKAVRWNDWLGALVEKRQDILGSPSIANDWKLLRIQTVDLDQLRGSR